MWEWTALVKGENLSGNHLNQLPDGPFDSWYGHVQVMAPKENNGHNTYVTRKEENLSSPSKLNVPKLSTDLEAPPPPGKREEQLDQVKMERSIPVVGILNTIRRKLFGGNDGYQEKISCTDNECSTSQDDTETVNANVTCAQSNGQSLDLVKLSPSSLSTNKVIPDVEIGQICANNVRVSVWWNFETCSVPRNANVNKVTQCITAAVRAKGIKGPIEIRAFGDLLRLSWSNQEALCSARINATHVPHGGYSNADWSLFVDLIDWVSQNPPPLHLFLISDDPNLAQFLNGFRLENYNILLASTDNADVHLCRAATIMWQWTALVKGENPSGKHFKRPLFESWYGHYDIPLVDPCLQSEDVFNSDSGTETVNANVTCAQSNGQSSDLGKLCPSFLPTNEVIPDAEIGQNCAENVNKFSKPRGIFNQILRWCKFWKSDEKSDNLNAEFSKSDKEVSSRSGMQEMFTGSFWNDVLAFLETAKGSVTILQSKIRQELVQNLQGPSQLKSFRERHMLHLMGLLASAKKWVVECPSHPKPLNSEESTRQSKELTESGCISQGQDDHGKGNCQNCAQVGGGSMLPVNKKVTPRS